MSSDDAVQEIKRRLDLAQVVGRYVKLKRQGRSYVGLCPFHREKTPSFFVHPDEGFFKCFGCDAKGDVFSFLERQTGQAFIDILKQLAEETGVELEERRESPEQRRRRQERKRLLQILALTQTWFRGRLRGEEGGGARRYLAEARKVPEEWVEHFALGFGGRDDGLLAYLEKESVSVEEAKRAGVIAEGRNGPYAFFQRRVTFPIRDVRGDVVSFAGRAFGEGSDKRPKYVNGPASPVYDKSRVLYGLYESLPALKRGKAGVLVEGQLDVLAVHRAGVPTAFAPCGTSLTEAHVEELKRFADRVVVCMDADAAGRAAAERAILMLLKAGFDVSWARLFEKDPDEMVRSGEGDALHSAVEGAPAALDVLIDEARREGAGSARDRVRAIDRLLPFLAAPPRELTRRQFVRAAAEALREDERVLWDEVEQRGKAEMRKRARRESAPSAGRASASSKERPAREPGPSEEGRALVPARAARRAQRPKPRWTEAERFLAEALMAYPLLVPRCGVLLEGLRNPELKDFIERLSDALVRYHDWEPHKVLLEHVHARPGSTIFDIVAELYRRKAFDDPSRIITEHAAAEAIDDYLLRFDARPLRERLREVQRAMAEAERSDELEEWKRLQGLQRVLIDDLRPLERLEDRPRLPSAALDAAPTPPTPALLEEPEPPLAPVVELMLPAPALSEGWGPSAEDDDPALDDDGWDDPL